MPTIPQERSIRRLHCVLVRIEQLSAEARVALGELEEAIEDTKAEQQGEQCTTPD